MKPSLDPPDRYSFYRSLLEPIRAAARGCGYAVGVHGSEIRDFDLIAAPWVEDAKPADDLARAVADAVGGHILVKHEGALYGVKPLGRRVYTIVWDGPVEERYPHPDNWAVFIDMSVAHGVRA